MRALSAWCLSALLLSACGDDEVSSGAAGAGGGDGGSSSAGTGGGGGATVDPLDGAPLAAGVRLDGITALQTTSAPLVEGGTLSASPIPLIAGRDAWFRGFVAADAPSGQVRLEVLVQQGADGPVALYSSPAVTPVNGLPDDPTTTPICFVPAEALTPQSRWAARLVADGATAVEVGSPHDARFPRDGALIELGAREAPPLRITLVPFQWDADDSARLPDTSPAALETLRALFVARFPVASVEITVHEAIPYASGLNFFGNVDFDDVNGLLYDLREAESAEANVYYYGMLAPSDSFDDYCSGSCVTGQSYVVDYPEDADQRVGAGVAFDAESAAATAVHEMGHMFGRYHAPCDVNSWDDAFPYDGGEIGVLGWDPRSATPLDPWSTTDFMGYCDPQGTSDYTFTALFARHVEVAGLSSFAPNRSRAVAPLRVTCTGRHTLGR